MREGKDLSSCSVLATDQKAACMLSAVKIGVLARLHCSSPTNPAPKQEASHSPRRSTDAGFFCFGDWAKFTLDVELCDQYPFSDSNWLGKNTRREGLV